MGLPKSLALFPVVVPAMAVVAWAMAAAAAQPAPGQASPDQGPAPLTAALTNGGVHDAAARLLLQPYADATGTALDQIGFDGTLDGLKALTGPQAPDIALVNGPVLAAGCAAHVFDKLDWGTLQRNAYLNFAATDCGAGAAVSAIVLAFDQDKLHGDPSWSDFWDVAKYPGRRGLPKTARGTLEIALMADGVSPGDVYKTLRSNGGVDRAFRKLDQLKPYVEWWDQASQPADYLTKGKVLLIAAPAQTLDTHGAKHPGLHWAGCLNEVMSWAVPQTAAHKQAALAAIAIAADAARQAQFAKATGLGPAVKAGFALLPAASRAANPALPEHLQACVPVDEAFWLENGTKLEARFDAWVSK